jgi:ABC-type antimicrobial peptide transport system permease subunit
VDGLVCLFILTQVLALTARERRPTLSILRACGAGRREVGLTLAGAAVLLVALAAPLAALLERLVLAPTTARVAAGYVSLPLTVGATELSIVIGGLLFLSLVAAAWTARRLERHPISAGLGDD